MASKIRALVTEAQWRGLWGTVRAIKMNKMGTMSCFVGEDDFKNRYFEDRTETYGRDRWVEYVDDRNPDSLKITPEWHAWLHHNIDTAPSQQPLPAPQYQRDAGGNPTGTFDAYMPAHHRLNKRFHGSALEKYEIWRPRRGAAESAEIDLTSGSSGKGAVPTSKDVLDLK